MATTTTSSAKTTVAVPSYGSKVTAGYAPGQSGIAVYNPNTGQPLAGATAAGAYNPNTGRTYSSEMQSNSTVSAEKAQADYNAKLASYTNTITGLQTQAMKTAADNAAKAQAAAKAQQDAQVQANEQAKLDIAKKQADAKAAAVGALTAPNKPTGNTYQYVDISGQTKTVEAPDPQTAMKIAPNIAKDSGVALIGQSPNVPDTKIPDVEPTLTPEQQYEQKILSMEEEVTSAYDVYKKEVDQIRNGTFPLTPTQQALVDATQASFDRAKAEQIQANKYFEGTVRQAGIRASRNEYTPEIEAGNIAQAVSYGISKIVDIDAKAAQAIATLKQGFDETNYKLINDSYDKYTKLMKDKEAAIMKLHDDAIQNEKDLRTYNLDVEKFQETKDANAFDRAYKLEDLALKKQQNSLLNGINRPTVSYGANGKPDAASQAEFLKTLPTATATAVKALADYTMNPANISSKNNQRAQLLELVHQYDPSFDESQYAARAKFNANWTAGQLMTNRTAINTVIKHIDTLSKAGENLLELNSGGWFGSKKYNSLRQLVASESSDPRVIAYNNAKVAVASEMAKVYKGTNAAPTEEEIKTQIQNQETNLSPEQFRTLIESNIELMTGRLTSITEEYQMTMGKAPEGVIGSSASKAIQDLVAKGYDINIGTAEVKTEMATKIQTALQSHSPTEVIMYLQNDPIIGPKVKKAKELNISDTDIINYLSQ